MSSISLLPKHWLLPWRGRHSILPNAGGIGRPLDPLTADISRLRAEGCSDVMAALRQRASDAQALVEALGALLALNVVRMHNLVTWTPAFDLLSFAAAARRHCALLHDGKQQLILVITDPFDTDQFAWARTCFGASAICLVSSETFHAWLAHVEVAMTALGSLNSVGLGSGDGTETPTLTASSDSLSLRDIGSDTSPAIRFVNSTLYDALKIGASDIHLESDPSGLHVKFRIDGVLTAMRRLDNAEVGIQAISRIKVMAQLDIAERRIPQDGRLQVHYQRRNIDVRVSIMPSIHGEDAVLRVLDREHLAQSLSGLTLAKLGYGESSQNALRALCRMPHGMMLVTGPTGSGKTTTLYAAIAETHQSRDKIITIEDPVEYQLPGVLQIPVNERKGLTFALGLRSILRHDPDKILVGEIRDSETAQIAVQSALTGHLVFTTVHANTVFDVMGRFEQFGIDAYTFSSAINGILAQRLLRRLCFRCAVEHKPDAAGKAMLPEISPEGGTPMRFKVAVGCEHCRGTGYSGRFALGELLTLTPELKALIAARATPLALQAVAVQGGWRSLKEQAIDAAAQGLTTLEEVQRVAI